MGKKVSKISSVLAFIGFLLAFSTKPVYAVLTEKMELNCEREVAERIYEGEVFGQTFVSQIDRFGIVFIKFSNFQDISDDVVVFRIKHSNSNGWYYQANYKVDQFQNNEYFPFGFPPIENAKGKEFTFELESTAGQPDDSIGVRFSDQDCRDEAYSTINGENSDRDIVFKLGIDEPVKDKLINDIKYRVSDDPVFFVLWAALVATVAYLSFRKS